MPISPEDHLRAQGLEPLTWEDALQRIENQLPRSGSETFRRLHRAFTAYPTEHTVRSFYDFAAARGLLPLLGGYRFGRLAALATALDAVAPRPGDAPRVLDVGAGGGWLATYLRDAFPAEVSVLDLSPEVRARLASEGFDVFADAREAEAAGGRFDLVLCADSLGEIHSDEDDWLADPANVDAPEYPGELEARYGFAEKLAPLRPLLAPGGSVLLFEPVPLPHFWQGAARGLEDAGWRVEFVGPEPARGLKLNLD